MLELIIAPVSEIPVLATAADRLQQQIADLVDEIIRLKTVDESVDTSHLEARVDHYVYEVYKLTPEQIALVEAEQN